MAEGKKEGSPDEMYVKAKLGGTPIEYRVDGSTIRLRDGRALAEAHPALNEQLSRLNVITLVVNYNTAVLEIQRAKYDARIASIKKENETLLAAYSNLGLGSTPGDVKAKVTDLEARLKDAQDANTGLAERISGAQQQVDEMDKKLKDAEPALQFYEQRAKKEKELDDIKGEYEKAQQELEGLQAGFTKAKEILAAYQALNIGNTPDDVKVKVTGLEQQVDRLKTDLEAGAKTQKVREGKRVAELEEKYAAEKLGMANEIKGLKSQRDELSSELQKSAIVLQGHEIIRDAVYARVTLPGAGEPLTYKVGLHDAILTASGKIYVPTGKPQHAALLEKFSEAREQARRSK